METQSTRRLWAHLRRHHALFGCIGLRYDARNNPIATIE